MPNELPMKNRKIAYFSMEIGYDSEIPNYSGGLGILAGDTLKSCADLRVPTVAVTLLSEEGYFKQELDENGNQTELPEQWDVGKVLKQLPKKVIVTISGRNVIVKGWIKRIEGITGFEVPVIYLDTDIPENSEYDRTITKRLYGGDKSHRLAQEIILGIAGYKLLTDLGYVGIEKYHLNEGHGSFVIVEMLNNTKVHTHKPKPLDERYDFEGIRKKVVFTTHTPVAAGHDKFDAQQVKDMMGDDTEPELIDRLLHDGQFNMTHIALDNSNYVNGVAKKHAEVSRKMFPNHTIYSITNGVHTRSWVSDHFKPLYDKYAKDWFWDPASLRFAKLIHREELWTAHMAAKNELIQFVNETCGTSLSSDYFTIGFARRSTPYKRLTLMFSDMERLKHISNNVGKFQIVIAGKAHPNDEMGKDLIKQVFSLKKQLKGIVDVAFIPNYNIAVAKKMVAGVDIWLNTPQRPMEASGTSGMKAAHNGVPQLSTLDGWWIEGCLEDITGWSIGGLTSEGDDAQDFYDKLEKKILPMFYDDRQEWLKVMRNAIALNASYFNTHRMVKEYVMHSYFE